MELEASFALKAHKDNVIALAYYTTQAATHTVSGEDVGVVRGSRTRELNRWGNENDSVRRETSEPSGMLCRKSSAK